MFNTLRNFSRKADRYGDLHFLSFYGAVLSRFAYLNDDNFYKNYVTVMGPIIQPQILQAINSVKSDNLESLLDDETLYGLNKTKEQGNIFADYQYKYPDTKEGKQFIDFVRLQMPQNINITNNEVTGEKKMVIQGASTENGSVRYISIGWSNYGEVYVVADKRMPNTILLLFRGTYSAKTAAAYSKPTSITPLTACKLPNGEKEKFLYGIFKITTEMIHTIIEALRFLAWDFLGAREPNSVKIITTGHSLGGAMCTDFSYLWMKVKKIDPYTTEPYNVLADNIVCLSYGSPRCMSSSVAKKFCQFVEQKKILYLRVTTRGDPVPALPPKMGYQHPCSEEPEMRKMVSEDCNNLLSARPKINVKYDKDLDCQNYKTRAFVPNPIAHTIYLDILFTNAVDILNFLKGIGLSKEVLRSPDGSTVCRIIMGENNNYSTVFFDVNNARQVPNNLDKKEETVLSEEKSPEIELTSATGTASDEKTGGFLKTLSTPKTFKIGGNVAEDIRMTAIAFNKCIINMKRITGDNFCPQKPADDILFDGFDDKVMPQLSCDTSLNTETTSDNTSDTIGRDTSSTTTGTGGKKTLKRRKHRKHNKKSIKRKMRRR